MANMKEKSLGILGEFKEFISRGNILDMAVGIIVGGAFTTIVKSLVNDILMPVIGLILGGINFRSLGIEIPYGKHPYINIGSFLESIIVFLITAACVFLLLRAVNRVFRGKKIEEAPQPAPVSEETVLLTEIRDLLKNQQN